MRRNPESSESKWFETASPSRYAERRRAPFVAVRVRRQPSVCSAVGVSGLTVPPSIQSVGIRRDAHGLDGWNCRECQAPGTPILRRVRISGVVSARGSPADFDGLGVTFVMLPAVGHCIGSLEGPTVHPTGSGYDRPRDAVSRNHENLRFSNDLVTASGQAASAEQVENPLRSDRFLLGDGAVFR